MALNFGTSNLFDHSKESDLGLQKKGDVTYTKDVFFADFTRLENGNEVRWAFKVPHDFTALKMIEVIFFAENNIAAQSVTITSQYAQIGEARNVHTASDGYSITTVTDKMEKIDISALMPTMEAEDYANVSIDNNTGQWLDIYGFRLRYE